MRVVDKFGHVQVQQSLSTVPLLLSVELLQPWMACTDVYFNTY